MEQEKDILIKMLDARLSDLLLRSDKGELCVGGFLSPAEQHFLRTIALRKGAAERVVFNGGYPDAEWKRLFVMPPYALDFDGAPEDKLNMLFDGEVAERIRPVRVTGSGYRTLSHRDYMGSVLSLGIERDAVGDFVLQDSFSAVIFCSEAVERLLLFELEKVASDKVRVESFALPTDFKPTREYRRITDTVASARLDCIVSALAGCSREKAQEAIRGGLCDLDHITEERCDRLVEPPCVISVRGTGKFNVLEIGGMTKKGRLRLSAEKYI